MATSQRTLDTAQATGDRCQFGGSAIDIVGQICESVWNVRCAAMLLCCEIPPLACVSYMRHVWERR